MIAVMTKLLLVLLLAAAGLGGAGCGGSSSGDSDITGVLWRWTGGQDASPPALHAVPDPQNYLLEFATDDTFSAKADCNQLHGSYSKSGSSLTLKPGPMTLAQCPPGSLSDTYVSQLGSVTGWEISDGQLSLKLKDGGTMFFSGG
jgi:heat shock protein HslJ